MKFSAVTVACLATGAYSRFAEPPTRVLARDVATITGAVNAVGQGIEKLGSAVKGFSGDAKPVQDSADKLISSLKDSESKVKGSDKLTLTDALGLQDPVKALQSKSETLVSDLKSRKPQIEKGGFCDLVREKVGSINSGSLALIKAVVDKVPTEAQPIAEGLASGLKKVLNSANEEFSKENCKNSGGGKSSSAAEPSSPATSAEPSSPATSAEPSSPASEEPSAPATSVEETSSQPTAPATTGATYPIPSGPANPPTQPTGTGVPTVVPTGQPPIVTAGAALVAPAGAVVMAVAAMML
ncbi:hydrophobic surface binding protein A domain-containing protein [Hirsutella rhossiliensis]|uniref:Hydrophobic surface binding protein A domain-containing protein n=1 Tax=Hirsutella rhossiliensis TaxID=111463 RepID=A0A9P8MP94_9HYPO|nr:hydrophobic surface binding protein A domain-containing protein [Hirsutella rhossiliensis]KAH0958922.1 hydrophobic surface binding protein A domain-containing protein [Hirsutella rhossiliensis]